MKYPKILNIPWLINKTFLYTASYCSIRKNNIILSLFPKTGSTWIRFFLFNYLNKLEQLNFGEGIDEMNHKMPEFGHRSMLNAWHFKTSPKIIKTHRPFKRIFRKNKIILVIRDPRDLIVSFYHYALAKKEFNFNGTVKDVIYHKEWGLEYFFKQFNSWEKHAGLIVKYEDLKANPYNVFTEILNYIKIPLDSIVLRNAIRASDFHAMKKIQANSKDFKNKFQDGFNFARSGQSNQWLDFFDADDIKYWNQCKEKHGFTYY